MIFVRLVFIICTCFFTELIELRTERESVGGRLRRSAGELGAFRPDSALVAGSSEWLEQV